VASPHIRAIVRHCAELETGRRLIPFYRQPF
jgi:hypothetical protein